MQKFEYRSPRFTVDLPIVLHVDGDAIAGRCKEIGREGMKVQLARAVPVQTDGTVSLNYKDVSLELRCAVAHAGPDYDGLKFHFESDRDRNALDRLIAQISGPSDQRGPVLVR